MTTLDTATTLAVVLGSAAGGAARYAVSEWVARSLAERFPWGTLTVNVSGAAVIGMWLGAGATPGIASALFVLGFLGSYTTVSTFALQALLLRNEGRWTAALGYVLASALGCLTAAGLGYLAVRGVMGGELG